MVEKLLKYFITIGVIVSIGYINYISHHWSNTFWCQVGGHGNDILGVPKICSGNFYLWGFIISVLFIALSIISWTRSLIPILISVVVYLIGGYANTPMWLLVSVSLWLLGSISHWAFLVNDPHAIEGGKTADVLISIVWPIMWLWFCIVEIWSVLFINRDDKSAK